jgi:antitoxin (DNA-binding transcriptional repressor) of toxin-antitoxin stability system
MTGTVSARRSRRDGLRVKRGENGGGTAWSRRGLSEAAYNGTADMALDAGEVVIHLCITMPATATIRDLRNRFPKIRRLVEAEGEVLLSESGHTKYRLVLHTEPPARTAPPVDYWARLTAHQPVALTAAQSQALHDDNRGDR